MLGAVADVGADSAPAAAVMALMVLGPTARALWNRGVIRKRNAKSRAKSALRMRARRWTFDETDNEDAGADAEDEKMASQEEERDAGV